MVPHLVARLDGLQRTLLHWLVHHDGLHAVSADHGALEMVRSEDVVNIQ